MRHCITIGLVLASLAAAARAETFTVDDNAPADFASIGVAAAMVSAGDVLLVMPGTYDGFFLGKPLTILGPGDGPKPRVIGTTIINTSSFTLAGLSLEHLIVDQVEGPARIDDCLIGGVTAGFHASLDVMACDQLLVTRSTVDGHSVVPGDAASAGAWIKTSTYALVDCSFLGGDAKVSALDECANTARGGGFLNMSDGQLTACSLIGGLGGLSKCAEFPGASDSGPGLTISEGHHDLRGGTTTSCGPSFPGWEGSFGWALGLIKAIVVIEPGTVGPGGLATAGQTLVITADVSEPTLLVTADTPQVPGGFGQIQWRAPAGAPGVLLVSLGGPLLTFPKIEGPIWTAAPALLSLPIVGGAGATSLDYHIPADDRLIGTVLTLQAVFPSVAGIPHPNKSAITNPTQLVIRF